MECPDGWEEAEGLLGSDIAFLAPPEENGAFRANVNLVAHPVDERVGIEAVAAAHAVELLEALPVARILDASIVSLGGHSASRVLVTYTDNAWDLTLEQWVLPLPTQNLVISATCENVAYAATALVFDEMAESVSVSDA